MEYLRRNITILKADRYMVVGLEKVHVLVNEGHYLYILSKTIFPQLELK